MAEQVCLTEEQFKEMEDGILKQVTDMSKSLLETFKFRLLYATKISEKQNKKTLKALKEFRAKNWDKKLTREEAYNKYVNLY